MGDDEQNIDKIVTWMFDKITKHHYLEQSTVIDEIDNNYNSKYIITRGSSRSLDGGILGKFKKRLMDLT